MRCGGAPCGEALRHSTRPHRFVGQWCAVGNEEDEETVSEWTFSFLLLFFKFFSLFSHFLAQDLWCVVSVRGCRLSISAAPDPLPTPLPKRGSTGDADRHVTWRKRRTRNSENASTPRLLRVRRGSRRCVPVYCNRNCYECCALLRRERPLRTTARRRPDRPFRLSPEDVVVVLPAFDVDHNHRNVLSSACAFVGAMGNDGNDGASWGLLSRVQRLHSLACCLL